MVTMINPLDTDSSKTFGLQHFHRYGDENLGGVALAANSTDRVCSISERKIGFINLNLPMEQLSVGADHGAAQPVQHGPSGLITPQSKHALQSQCADTMLLAGDVPNGGEPDAKLSACLVKNGACCCRRLMPACRTNQSTATASLNLRYHPALRTDQPVRPAQLFQIVPTGLFGVKPIKELNSGRWIVFPTDWGSCWCVHLANLPSVELKGYPVCMFSNAASRMQAGVSIWR